MPKEEVEVDIRQNKDSEASDEDLMRRQIEAIEDIVEGKGSSHTSKSSSSKASSKKPIRQGLTIDSQADPNVPSTSKLETPKETNALTSSRKIFDLSAQNLKGKENLESLPDNPILTKQGSLPHSLQQSLDTLVLA